MLLNARERAGIESGAISCVFRSWATPRAKAGAVHSLPSSEGALLIEAVEPLPVPALSEADAMNAGFGSLEALLADITPHLLGGSESVLYRVMVRPVPKPAKKVRAIDEVRARLAKIDVTDGAWTYRYLALISGNPQVSSATLAPEVEMERFAFKARVRRLKALGLTESFDVGYGLTPLGRHVVEAGPLDAAP